MQPERVVVGVPVASTGICARLRREADDVVCSLTPDPFHGVGFWYAEFDPVQDREVERLLQRAGLASRRSLS